MIDSPLPLAGDAASLPSAVGAPILVLALGTSLGGDAGVGAHVLRELESSVAIPGMRLLDQGSRDYGVLESISLAQTVIVVGSTADGNPPGTITEMTPRSLEDLPADLSMEDNGLRDFFAAGETLGERPDVHLIRISIEARAIPSVELNPNVAASVIWVARAVQCLAYRLAAEN